MEIGAEGEMEVVRARLLSTRHTVKVAVRALGGKIHRR